MTILTFQGVWNEFFWPLIILGFGDPDMYTLQLGIAQFTLPVPDPLAAADGGERDRDPADRRRSTSSSSATSSPASSRAASRDEALGARPARRVAGLRTRTPGGSSLLNGALSRASCSPSSLPARFLPAALVLGSALGPLAAALMHCAVTLVRDQETSRSRARSTGVRLHWRRGLELAALTVLVVLAGLAAVRALRLVPASSPGRLPSSSLYVLGLFLVFELVLWPLAIAERERAVAARAPRTRCVALVAPAASRARARARAAARSTPSARSPRSCRCSRSPIAYSFARGRSLRAAPHRSWRADPDGKCQVRAHHEELRRHVRRRRPLARDRGRRVPRPRRPVGLRQVRRPCGCSPGSRTSRAAGS